MDLHNLGQWNRLSFLLTYGLEGQFGYSKHTGHDYILLLFLKCHKTPKPVRIHTEVISTEKSPGNEVAVILFIIRQERHAGPHIRH